MLTPGSIVNITQKTSDNIDASYIVFTYLSGMLKTFPSGSINMQKVVEILKESNEIVCIMRHYASYLSKEKFQEYYLCDNKEGQVWTKHFPCRQKDKMVFLKIAHLHCRVYISFSNASGYISQLYYFSLTNVT